jgi:hypothetical protein
MDYSFKIMNLPVGKITLVAGNNGLAAVLLT